MKKTYIIILVIAVIAVIALLYYFLIYSPSQSASAAQITEGAPCKVQGKIPGTIKGGICVPTITEGSISLK